MSCACKILPDAQKQELGQARFKVSGDASSQLLMRIFGLLAQQDLLPEHATARSLKGVLIVQMETALLSRHRAVVIAQKMNSLVETHRVQLCWKPPRGKVPNLIDRLRFASGPRAD